MRLFLAAALMAVASPALAETTTITFDEMTNPEGVVVPTYERSGYQFTPVTGARSDFFFFMGEIVRPQGWIADPTGSTLINSIFGSTFRLSRQDGATFDLASFDIADLFNNGLNSFDLTANYVTAGGSVVSTYQTDLTPGLQRVAANQAGLRWVDFTVARGSLQFDNFALSSAQIAAVPEPATWAMMMAGVGMVGGAMRRRRRVQTTFATA